MTTDTPVTPPDQTPPAPVAPPAIETSIAAHEAHLDQQAEQQAKPPTRYHREKDIATPRDVPRIRELAGKVKTVESERDDWKAKYEALEAQRQTPVAPVPAPAVPAPVQEAKTPAPVQAPPERFQKFAEWAADPANASKDVDDYLDARDTWNDARKQHVAEQAKTTEADTAARTKAEAELKRIDESYQGRVQAFAQTHADFDAKLAKLPRIPEIFIVALKLLDTGPEVVYNLSEPLVAEMHLLADGKPISEPAVAAAQRWLTSRVSTGSTGAVSPPPTPVPQVPRPPTPVRTGPQAPSDDPPGDGASIAQHERYYGPRR